MYTALYEDGKQSFVVAAIGLPPPVHGRSAQALSWWSAYGRTVEQVLDRRDIDIGFRVESSDEGSRRTLLLSTRAEARDATVELCKSFDQLNGIECGSVEFCTD